MRPTHLGLSNPHLKNSRISILPPLIWYFWKNIRQTKTFHKVNKHLFMNQGNYDYKRKNTHHSQKVVVLKFKINKGKQMYFLSLLSTFILIKFSFFLIDHILLFTERKALFFARKKLEFNALIKWQRCTLWFLVSSHI